jgi:Chaperone of endosialidase
MPSDDLLLNVRQIAQYAPTGDAPPTASILMQIAGLGSPYQSISPAALVGTALAQGGDMAIGGQISALSFQGGAAQFSNAAVGLLGAQKACIVDFSATRGAIGGSRIATATDIAGVLSSTVLSFNGRQGAVCLWIQDILAAGGAPNFSPVFGGAPRAPTPAASSHSSRLATTAFVHRNSVEYIDALLACHPFVFTFNGRSGDIVLTQADIEAALADAPLPYAPLDSPAFTGYPTAPTAPPGSQTAQLATTAFVMSAVQDSTTGVASFNGRTGIVALTPVDITNAGGATLASPVFTGAPQAPTAAPGTDTAQLATCAWVINELGGVTSGVASFNGRAGAVVLTLADVTGVGGAPLASPALNGVPTAPTATTGTSTQQLATTAFVAAAVSAGSVASFNGRTGAVTLTANDISAAGGAALASPSFTGVPLSPTAAPGANSAQIATTAFVTAALAATGVSTFNGRAGAVTLTIGDVTTALPASTTAPLIDGTAAAGTATSWSRGNHVHPTDTTRYSASNPSGFQTAAQLASALAAYVPIAGGVIITNALTILPGAAAGNALSLTLAGLTNTTSLNLFDSPGGNDRMDFAYNHSAGFGGIFNNVTSTSLTLDGGGAFNYGGGSGVATKAGGGAWTAASDDRIKTVTGDYELGLDAVMQLHPVVFTYNGNDTTTADLANARATNVKATAGDSAAAPFRASPHYQAATKKIPFVGFIAQELEQVCPGMVTQIAGFIDGEAVTDLRQVDVSNLVYMLVNAVKALTAKVETLETRTAT